MELICSIVVSFSEPQLSPKVATLKHARSQHFVFDSFLMMSITLVVGQPTFGLPKPCHHVSAAKNFRKNSRLLLLVYAVE
jgi:hypothetical protein